MTAEMTGADSEDIRVGNSCLLSVMNQLFLVEILEVNDDTMRVTFAGMDYPVEGMQADLEFHDKLGFNCYRTIVLEGPKNERSGIVLMRPRECSRARHRDSCRVPTDLTVQVKDQEHFRRYDAALINLSAGGTLISTEAPFDLDATIEIHISLPGEPTHKVLGHIVHVGEDEGGPAGAPRLLGVRFVTPDPDVVESIVKYIWRRLREIYRVI